MKRFFAIFAIIASAISFIACQKEITSSDDVKTHKVMFKAVFADETKTVLAGNHAEWISSDASLFHVFEDGKPASDLAVTISNGIATIEAMFPGEETEAHRYTAFVGNINTNKKASVKTTQTPTAGSYDPEADILFAKPIENVSGEDAFDGLTFQFRRVVSINKMTLKGIPAEESVQKVVIEGNYSILFSYDDDGNEVSGSKLLTVNTSSKDVYFITSEAKDITVTVTVTTDEAVYSKTFGPISFQANGYKPFGVTLEDRKTDDKEYVLVNNVNDLMDGDKIVLGSMAKSKAAGNLGTNQYFSSQDAEISDFTLKSANAVEITLNQVDGHWTMTTSEGQIGATAQGKLSKNPDASNYVGTWDISFNSEGNATISSTNDAYGSLFYNASSPRFTSYTSNTQTPIEIYKLGATKPKQYNVNIPVIENLTFDKSSFKTFPGCIVTIKATPALGFDLGSFTASVDGEELNTDGVLSFTMPDEDVTISASVNPHVGNVFTALFGSSYNSAKVSSYTSSFSSTNDGFTVNLQNFNNNNSGWDYVKTGNKNSASVGTITTDSKISVSSVSLTIDSITSDKVNSITLYSGTSSDSITTEEGTFELKTGTQTISTIASKESKYYRISFDCQKGSSNGLVTVSKVKFAE